MIFEWKIFRFFQFGEFLNMSSKVFCGDQKQSGKNIEYFLRYFQKPCFFGFSKWYVRPSVLPSIQVGWTPGTPRREIRRLEHSTCKTRHSTCKTSHSRCKTVVEQPFYKEVGYNYVNICTFLTIVQWGRHINLFPF